VGLHNTNTTADLLADFVSLNADGFTINLITAPATARIIGYIALGGIQAKLGNFAQPSVTGNQQITGVGFTPKIVLFTTHGINTLDATASHGHHAIGVGVSSTERGVKAGASQDGQATQTIGSQRSSASRCIFSIKPNQPSDGSILSDADFVSQDIGAFTVNWITADGTARVMAYLAIGEVGPDYFGQRRIPEDWLLRSNRLEEARAGV
jgi:hypothetical protein